VNQTFSQDQDRSYRDQDHNAALEQSRGASRARPRLEDARLVYDKCKMQERNMKERNMKERFPPLHVCRLQISIKAQDSGLVSEYVS